MRLTSMKETLTKKTQKETDKPEDDTYSDIHNWGLRVAARIIQVEVTGVGGRWRRDGIRMCNRGGGRKGRTDVWISEGLLTTKVATC